MAKKSDDPISNWGTLQTPYSQEAEEATLGALLVNGDAFEKIKSHIGQADAFFVLRHRYVWEAMGSLHEKGEPIDYLTVTKRLKEMKHLEEIGGAAYLAQLSGAAPELKNAPYYAQLVKRAFLRRVLMAQADEIKAMALDETLTIEEVIGKAQAGILSVEPPLARRKPRSMKDVMSELYDDLEDRVKNKKNTMGISTGWKGLDRILGGWRKDRFIIVGGRPGMGKTAFLLEAAMRVARQKRTKDSKETCNVLVISLEMNAGELGERQLTNKADIDTHRLLSIEPSDDDRKAMIAAMGELAKVTVWIDDDTIELTTQAVETKIQEFIREHGHLEAVMIDYIGLMTPLNPRRNAHEAELIGTISRQLKALTRKYHLPIIVGAQLNRDVEKRKGIKNKEPQLSDLRGSGSLEQDADVVLCPFFPNYYTNPEMKQGDWWLIVLKQRNGPLGRVKNYADFSHASFTEVFS